jgi:hypothetical protein
MSASAFLGQVAECQRLLRHYRRIKDEVKKPSRAWRFTRGLLPWAAIPLLVLPLGIGQGTFTWAWVGLGLLVATGAHIPARLTTFEALRMPSRRALYVARLLPVLSWWLCFGFCATAVLLASHREMIQNGEEAALYLLIGAQLPWLVFGSFGILWIVVKRWWAQSFLGGLLGFAVVSLASQHQALSPYLALVPPGMLLLEIGLVALQVWGLDRLEPMWQMGLIAPLHLPRPAHQETPAPRGGVPNQLGPAPLLAGRRHGLEWAAAYHAIYRLLGSGFRRLVRQLFWSAVLLGLTLWASDEREWWWWYGVVSLNYWLGGSALRLDHPQRLYLLGVDYRRQLLHRLGTFWVTPGLLVVSVGVVLSVALWGAREMPLALLALTAGLTLFSEGWFGWPDWDRWPALKGRGWWPSPLFFGLALWLGFLICAGRWVWLPDPGWDTATRTHLFAAACGACGLVGLAYKWWWFDEAALDEAMRR